MARRENKCLMGCSIKGEGKEGPHMIEGEPSGLILNHAYGLVDAIEIADPHDHTRPFKLLRLRNPWGNSEWDGAWSTESEEMKKYKNLIMDYIKTLPLDEQFRPEDDDGTFFMHYDDWKDVFTTLFINNDFPEFWTGVRFESAWTNSNAAGLPTTYTRDALENFARNPQFLVRPVEDCEVVISLHQDGGRLPENGKYYNYPFSETLDYNCLSVFKLPYGDRYLRSFDRNSLVYLSPIKREVETCGRMKMSGGETYVIVPSNELAGVTGKFWLSLYVN